MEEDVKFNNIEGKNYLRTYASSVYISYPPSEEVLLDFYEEYVDSISMLNQSDLDEEDESLFIIREKKVSILMSKTEAVYFAQRILDKFSDEEDLEEEGALIHDDIWYRNW